MLGKVCLALPLTCYLLYGMVSVTYYASFRMCSGFELVVCFGFCRLL